jgi:hypothetical protein
MKGTGRSPTLMGGRPYRLPMSTYDEEVLSPRAANQRLLDAGVSKQDADEVLSFWQFKGWHGMRGAKITRRYVDRAARELLGTRPSKKKIKQSRGDVRTRSHNPLHGSRGARREQLNTAAGAKGDERYRDSPDRPRLKDQGTLRRTKSGRSTLDRSALNLTPAQLKKLKAADKKRKNRK